MNRRGFFAGVGAALATLAGADKLAKVLEPEVYKVKMGWNKVPWQACRKVQSPYVSLDGGFTVPEKFRKDLEKLCQGKPVYGKPLIIKEGVRYEKVPDGVQPVDYCYALNAIAG